VVIVAKRNIWRDHGDMGSAVGGDDEREIRYVACGGCTVIMRGATGIEVGASGRKVGRIALCNLVDVNRVLARRKVFHIQRDLDPFLRAGKQRFSHALAINVFELNSDWLGRGVAMSLLGLCAGS
jgi:hypothetical protein